MNRVTAPAALHILVVDDCPDTTASMAMLLNLWGHTAGEARGGPAALAAIAIDAPDVFVLDLVLSGAIDGCGVARRLRARPATADAVLICVSGQCMADDRRRARAAGFDHFFAKPPDLEELRHLLAVEADVRKSMRRGGAGPTAADLVYQPEADECFELAALP